MSDRLHSRLAVLAPALLRLAGLALLATIVGVVWSAQAGLWVAVLGLVILLLIHLRYAILLAAWLEHPRLEDVPDGWGVWADVFARLYRTQPRDCAERAPTAGKRGAFPAHDQRPARGHRADRHHVADRLVQSGGPAASGRLAACRPGPSYHQSRARSRVRRLHDLGTLRFAAGVSTYRPARPDARGAHCRVRSGAFNPDHPRHHAARACRRGAGATSSPTCRTNCARR